MKNIELLNYCYKYFNRYITAEQLVELLENINKTSFTKKELHEFNKLIKEIKKISNSISNEEDEYIKKEKAKTKKILKKIESLPKEDKYKDFLDNQINDLKKDYARKRDSYERWNAIATHISQNNYFNICFENLSDYELLEFIAQYICAPFPPNLSDEEFNKLVKIGIEKDKREWLWRLAFNYENDNMNLEFISDYFIEKKDGYYLAELISAVGHNLNIDNIIDKINDKSLIKDLKKRKNVIQNYVSEEQFNKLISKLN